METKDDKGTKEKDPAEIQQWEPSSSKQFWRDFALAIEPVAGISEAQATFMLQPFHHSPQLCQTKANRLRLRHYCLVFVRCAQYVSVNAIKMQFKCYLYALITLITLIAFHRWLDAALLSSWRASESSPCGSPSCDQIDSIR